MESALFPLICGYFISCTYTLQSPEDLSSYGIDWNGPPPSSLWHGELDDERTPIEVPTVTELLQPEGSQVLAERVDAMAGLAQKIEIFFQGLFKDFSRTKIIFQGPFMECHVTRLAK